MNRIPNGTFVQGGREVANSCSKHHCLISVKGMVKALEKVTQEGCGIVTLAMVKTKLDKTLNNPL